MRRILFAILCIFLCASVLPGCGGNDYIVHHAATEAQQEQIRWHKYSQTILLTAHYSKRPVLLYFDLDGCPACEKMEKTFSDRGVIKLINSSYLPIRVNSSEKQFDNLAAQFDLAVDGTIYFPSILVLSSTNIPETITKVSGY